MSWAVLAPFWLPTWGQLGAQDGFKIEKMRSKQFPVAHPKRFEMRPCCSTPSWAVLAPFDLQLGAIFGHLGSVLGHLGSVLGRLGSVLAPFWLRNMVLAPFWAAWFSSFLASSSADLQRESKNLPRTKPKTNSVQTPKRIIRPQSLVFQNFGLPQISVLTWAAVFPEGGFN